MTKKDSEENVFSLDQKFQVIMKEFDYVQDIIKYEAENKIKTRSWAITTYSAIIGLSIFHENYDILWIAVLTTLVFWFHDATRHSIHSIALARSREIQEFLRQHTADDKFSSFQSPMFGEYLTDRKMRNKHLGKASTRRIRVIMYGMMIVGPLVIYMIM